jgi:coenzyme PQQ biosynthesis protein PqqD
MLINSNQTIKLSPLHRLQWEESKQKDVIIYPEGIVELNQSSAEILKLCDGFHNLSQIVTELENKFVAAGLTNDITVFLETAFNNGWVVHGQIEADSQIESKELNNTASSESMESASKPSESTTSEDVHTRRYSKTALHLNPFYILGATTRDDKQRIVKLAEEMSLELDHDICQKSRSDLTNPRTRLGAEMAWLPGISPKKTIQLTNLLLEDPKAIWLESGLPSLAHANLMAAAFESVQKTDDPSDISQFIYEMAYLVDEIAIDDVVQFINEDRAISGFSEVRSLDQVESELIQRKRYFKKAIIDALNRLPSSSLVEAMTDVVDWTTDNGNDHAPELVDDLVDSYEVECHNFLQKEAENIKKLIAGAFDSATSGEAVLNIRIDKLISVARNWNKVAQPIKLSAKARGIKHEPSNEIAVSIRSLEIDLFQKFDMLTQVRRINELLQELFSELPDFNERITQDTEFLENEHSRRSEWVREISYSVELGMVFKDTLSISPNGVTWKKKIYPLDAITRVRWGGIKRSVNGVPTGTTYTIAFGDSFSEAIVELSNESIYSTFIDKLWRAVCARILTQLLESLKVGKEIRFGEAVINDNGITLVKHNFWGANESIRCSWQQIHIWSGGGCFYIGHRENKKTYVGLSYIDSPNVHILEQVIRIAFKIPGINKLSEILNQDS